MFNIDEFNKKDLNFIISELIKRFPNIDKDIITNRVTHGYIFGEGENPIVTLENWIEIFDDKMQTNLIFINDAYYAEFITSGLVIIYNFKTNSEYAIEKNN